MNNYHSSCFQKAGLTHEVIRLSGRPSTDRQRKHKKIGLLELSFACYRASNDTRADRHVMYFAWL